MNFYGKTDKLTVYYHKMSPVDLSAEYLTLIVKPWTLALPSHEYIRVGNQEMMADPRGALGCLKRAILKRFHKMLGENCNDQDIATWKARGVWDDVAWMFEIDDVELIDCHLLVPKSPSYDVPHALLVDHVADALELPRQEDYIRPIAFQEMPPALDNQQE